MPAPSPPQRAAPPTLTPSARTILQQLANLRRHNPGMWVSVRELERTTNVNTAAQFLRTFVACGWAERRQRNQTTRYPAPLEYRCTRIGLTAARTQSYLKAEPLCHNETPAETSRQLISARRAELTRKVVTAYRAGVSIRTIAANHTRSYGLIHKLLREAGEPLRSRGRTRYRSPPPRRTDAASSVGRLAL
jgi:hypothetical protein